MFVLQLLIALVITLSLAVLSEVHTTGLKEIPGPFFARFSNLWRLIETWRGHYERTVQDLHRRHGNIVRIGPKIVSLTDPDVIESIYGVKADLPKVRVFAFCQWSLRL